MNSAQSTSRSIFLTFYLVILAACQPTPPTSIAQQNIQVTGITQNDILMGQIIQVKTFDRCNAAGAFSAEVKFSEGVSETTQRSLALTVGGSAEAQIPATAKVQLEAAVEERFSYTKQNNKTQEESVRIEVPAYTRQEYTIIWKERRSEGTIEYTIDGEQKIANYSYRVGLEFDSTIGRDIDCSLPTATPVPSETSVPSTVLITATPRTLALADGCVFSKTWKADTQAPSLANPVPIRSDGCYALDELGIFANAGTLHLFKNTGNNTAVSGISTPINSNSVIEFNIYVNSLSTKLDNVSEVIFAVTPADDRLTARSTARFKLHVEDPGDGRVVHFTMADAGENTGVNLGTQHYEYGHTYKISLLLSPTEMNVFIDGYRMIEGLDIPLGAKAFYIGYDLPVFAEMDVKISNITVDGLTK